MKPPRGYRWVKPAFTPTEIIKMNGGVLSSTPLQIVRIKPKSKKKSTSKQGK
jgi:hypothetical protein